MVIECKGEEKAKLSLSKLAIFARKNLGVSSGKTKKLYFDSLRFRTKAGEKKV